LRSAINASISLPLRLRLIVEVALDRLPEVAREAVVVRLVHGLDEPVDAVGACAIDRDVLLLSALGTREAPGELHDLPRSGRCLPDERAVLDRGGEVDETPAIDGIALQRASRQDRDQVRVVEAGLAQRLRPLDADRRGLEALAAVLGRHAASHHLARPPPVVVDDHRQIVRAGEVEADPQIAVPTFPEPVLVGAGLGREDAVAALEHLRKLAFELRLGLIAVHPEERPGQTPRVHGELAELPFEGRERRLGGHGGGACKQGRKRNDGVGTVEPFHASFLLRLCVP
jgi:hypothetical protein